MDDANVPTQVGGMILHYSTIENSVAELREALCKVELISTSGSDCGNKRIARNGCGRVCYIRQFFVQIVSQQNCETSCRKNWPNVTQALVLRDSF